MGTLLKSGTSGDISWFTDWVEGEGALIITRKPNALCISTRRAYAICISAAWLYNEDDYLMTAAFNCAEILGMHPDKSTVYRIAKVMNDGIQELIETFPEPDTPTQVVEATVNGQTTEFVM